MLEPRPRTLLRAFIAAAAMALAAPSLAGAADQLNLIDKTEPVGPGITLKHQKFLNSSGWYDEQVLTVDLSNSAVKSDLLTAPHVAQGEALSSMAGRAGAAAGVNGDFFDIDSTQASLGGEIQAGQLIKSADASGWAHVGVEQERPRPARRPDAAGERRPQRHRQADPDAQRGQLGRRPGRQHHRLHVRVGQPDPQPQRGGRGQRRRGPGRRTTRSSRSTTPPARRRDPGRRVLPRRAATPAPTPSRRSSPATRSSSPTASRTRSRSRCSGRSAPTSR